MDAETHDKNMKIARRIGGVAARGAEHDTVRSLRCCGRNACLTSSGVPYSRMTYFGGPAVEGTPGLKENDLPPLEHIAYQIVLFAAIASVIWLVMRSLRFEGYKRRADRRGRR